MASLCTPLGRAMMSCLSAIVTCHRDALHAHSAAILHPLYQVLPRALQAVQRSSLVPTRPHECSQVLTVPRRSYLLQSAACVAR